MGMKEEPGTGAGVAGDSALAGEARRERSARRVYFWLLLAPLVTVPWMAFGLNTVDRDLAASRIENARLPDDIEPAWSPDGASIAFASDRAGKMTIYIIHVNETPRALLHATSGIDYDPDWSPDGRQIVFASNREDDFEIYTVNVDGTGLRRLTNSPGDDRNPAWSPDGGRIAFSSDRAGNEEIYVMDTDGGEVAQVTTHPGDDLWPDWYPNGKRLLFTSDRDGGRSIYAMNIGGEIVRRITEDSSADARGQWSPDGRHVVFSSWSGGNSDVYVMTEFGHGLYNLTLNPAADQDPAWDPTSDLIAFSSDRSGRSEIYIMNSDGSGVVSVSPIAAVAVPAPRPSDEDRLARFITAALLPTIVHAVLLLGLMSSSLYVRRHAQQAVLMVGARALSTGVILGTSGGGAVGLWLLVNGLQWGLGARWGLRQVGRGDCWLMRLRGEASELPRPWARPEFRAPSLATIEPEQALMDGNALLRQGDPVEATQHFLAAFRSGSSEHRARALLELEKLGQVERF